MNTVSILVEIPEELHRWLLEHLENPDDMDEFVSDAIAQRKQEIEGEQHDCVN